MTPVFMTTGIVIIYFLGYKLGGLHTKISLGKSVKTVLKYSPDKSDPRWMEVVNPSHPADYNEMLINLQLLGYLQGQMDVIRVISKDILDMDVGEK